MVVMVMLRLPPRVFRVSTSVTVFRVMMVINAPVAAVMVSGRYSGECDDHEECEDLNMHMAQ